MKKQKKKNLNKILLISIVTILVIVVFFMSTKQSISVTGVPPFEESLYWSSIDANVLITAPFIGSYNDAPRQDICGGNDGDFNVNNDYDLNENLKLSTSFLNINKRGCNDINEINAEFISKKTGILNIDLSANGYESRDGCSKGTVSIKINGVEQKFEAGQIEDGRDCNRGSNPNSISLSKEYNISEGDKVIIRLTSEQGYSGSGSATTTLSFIPKIIPEETQIYYRFSNNNCSQINILPSTKTSNDYSNLAECKSNIIMAEPIPEDTNDGVTESSKINIIGIFIILTILILLIIIIRNLIKRKRK